MVVGRVVEVAVQHKENVGLVVVAGELIAVPLVQGTREGVHQKLQEQRDQTHVKGHRAVQGPDQARRLVRRFLAWGDVGRNS